MLEKICSKLEKGEHFIIAVLLLIMTVMAFTQVITRYVFSFTIIWLEEATRYCMIWMRQEKVPYNDRPVPGYFQGQAALQGL